MSEMAERAALDPEDQALRKIVGDAYREGMRAFLDNDSIWGGSIGEINDAMQDAGARAAIAALRDFALSPPPTKQVKE